MADEIQIIGEVIESSTTEFVAESRELHSPPPFGSFVAIGLNGMDTAPSADGDNVEEEDPFDPFRKVAGSFNSGYHQTISGEAAEEQVASVPITFAIVYQASTTPVDTGRRLRAYWKDEEQLKEEQPELSEWMLVTNFRAVIIGHCTNGTICQFLPPQPPKLLTPVRECTPEEVRKVTSQMGFLRTLSNFHTTPSEEIMAACIRYARAQYPSEMQHEFLVTAGKELASLMKDDYDRLQAIVRRVAP